MADPTLDMPAPVRWARSQDAKLRNPRLQRWQLPPTGDVVGRRSLPAPIVLQNILYVGFVKAGDLSGCDSRPANWSLQPVAIEEVTNRLRPRFKVKSGESREIGVSLETPEKIRKLQTALHAKAKGSRPYPIGAPPRESGSSPRRDDEPA
ncbi:MAG: hypothetical protein WBE26_08770 [Phycisphaerae bacterium]